MADVTLSVNGQAYAGWQSVRITRGIECLAGAFQLGVSDRWNGQSKPWPIQEEDECSVAVGGVTILTGYVDKRHVSYSSSEHSLSVSGRDKAGALVDCSAVLGKWEFHNVDLLTLAKRLADPFGIAVSADPALGFASVSLTVKKRGGGFAVGGMGRRTGTGVPKPPKKFSINPGDSAFEVLDRACRAAGVLPVSDGVGGIVLMRSGGVQASTQIVEGQNILSASGEYDAAARYARYVVMAQHAGSDEWFGGSAAAIRGEATDGNVKRSNRVLMIRPESGLTPQSARARAQWEANVRAARGDSVSVTVQGWTQADGSLWPINAIVRVKSPTIGVNGNMLITQTQMNLDSNAGTTTQLTLRRPDAFLPEPAVANTGGGAAWKELRKGV